MRRDVAAPPHRPQEIPHRGTGEGTRRALLVSYYFPPIGGGGVTRSLRVARALAGAGWQPWVLTVDAAVWAHDPSRLSEIPQEARLLRLPNPDWGRIAARLPSAPAGRAPTGAGRLRRWLVPDLHVGWSALAGFAAALGTAVGAFDLVHATAPPYSAFLAGRLAGLLGTPWIADFRDGWTCCPTRADLPRWRRNLEHRMEVGVLTSADRVLFASPGVRERYVREISGLAERSETLLTGFDAPGFSQECGASGRSPRLELLHVGSVFLMRRERTLQKFLEGLGLWMASAPGDRTRIRVRFLGAEPAVAEMVASAGLAEVVECLPSVPRSGLATELRGADAALVLQPPGPLGGDPIPGKLFDATGAGCPLLLMGTEGALPGLVRRLDLGPVVDPADPGGIARALDQASERVRAGEPVHRLPASSLRALSSESFAARIVEISEELTSPGGARCPSPSVS